MIKTSERRVTSPRGKLVIAVSLASALVFIDILGGLILRYAYGLKGMTLLSYFLITLCTTVILVSLTVYFVYSRRGLILNLKELSAVYACMAIGYSLSLCLSLVTCYLMPIAITAFLIAPIAKRRDAFVCSLACVLLVMTTLLIGVGDATYPDRLGIAGITAPTLSDIIPITLVGILSGSIAAYTVSNDTKRISYVLKGLAIGIGGVAILSICLVCRGAIDELREVLPFMGIAAVLQVTVGLLLQPIVERIFNLVTNSRLVELTDRNSPLIERLTNEALGTFSHCMSVANFAEMCAVAIGENPYLARACAYYHDVGKLMNPLYFKENQAGTANPHDDLLPEVSAEIIRSHTTEGIKLCQKYRIPEEVSHVIVQHHGTLLIPVFYEKAKRLTDGEVNSYEYSYHGITPITKIAAIIMICDSGEAAIRAMDNPTGERVDKLIKGLIDSRLAAGQFDNCEITMRDLNVIRRTMVDSFGGLYHQRLKYPDGK